MKSPVWMESSEWLAARPLEDWNEAYTKVESYFSALRVRDKLLRAHLVALVLERAVPVYHKVDYIKVTPETALARLGSDVHPKGYQQFEAIGYENGPDGKPNTADDVTAGGPVAPDAGAGERAVSAPKTSRGRPGPPTESRLITPRMFECPASSAAKWAAPSEPASAPSVERKTSVAGSVRRCAVVGA